MMTVPEYYIGVMSGTSLGTVDVALVEIQSQSNFKFNKHDSESQNDSSKAYCSDVKLVHSIEAIIPAELNATLGELAGAQEFNLVELFDTEIQLAKLFASAVNQLLENKNLHASAIKAIGCHGVTIRHAPNGNHAFSKQIGDSSTLAALTGIDVVSDFRMADVAEGGQGAPLVPPFHFALFGGLKNMAVLNLGGIGNISMLNDQGELIGFDTGPANTLLDLWCKENTGNDFDSDGRWAASGEVNSDLLAVMLADPYFSLAPPKSTGKEHFNLEWLRQKLAMVVNDGQLLMPQDIQATLVQLTVESVSGSLNSQFHMKQLVVCGGGVHNALLMSRLALKLPNIEVLSSAKYNVSPDDLEAMAFAWLAYCRVHDITGNAPSVTGAQKQKVLGAWYKK